MDERVSVENFVELCQKTSSTQDEGTSQLCSARLCEDDDLWCGLYAFFQQSKALGEFADRLKKHIFYGKESDVGYDTEFCDVPRQPSLQVIKLLHSALGIYTEAVELMAAIEPSLFDKDAEDLDVVNAREELFDVDWYISEGLSALGVDKQGTWELGIAKLKKRFGEKFNETGAKHRDLDAEREILEGKKFDIDAIDSDSGLTKDEKACMDHLVAGWDKYCELPNDSVVDSAEFVRMFHRLQDLLAVRVVRREHPRYWRTGDSAVRDGNQGTG